MSKTDDLISKHRYLADQPLSSKMGEPEVGTIADGEDNDGLVTIAYASGGRLKARAESNAAALPGQSVAIAKGGQATSVGGSRVEGRSPKRIRPKEDELLLQSGEILVVFLPVE